MTTAIDAVEILRKRYGRGWQVKYNSRFPEWNERSCPYIVDENSQVIADMAQHVGHPGLQDHRALDHAYLIIDAVNRRLEEDGVRAEYLEKMKKMEYGKCVRLYDKDGNHILSVLRCIDNPEDFDLTAKNGKILCCASVTDYWPVAFAEHFPIEDAKEE